MWHITYTKDGETRTIVIDELYKARDFCDLCDNEKAKIVEVKYVRPKVSDMQ